MRTKSHARILLGKAGSSINRIKKAAQQELSKTFNCPVDLHLHIRLIPKNRHLHNEDKGSMDDELRY